MKITPEAERAVAAIVAVGGRPFLVGGCVRDWIIGVESKDIDIEVHGPVSVDVVETVLRTIGRVDAVGKSFGVLKFGREVDISFPRRDSKSGDGHTGFSIEIDQSMSTTEALARRDFTINSIAVDAVTHEIFDPFGGLADIGAGIIRHTSDAFADDPLRVLRAIQFASRFGFTIAPETAALCQSLVGRFSELSVERVWMEWEKIFSKGKSMLAVSDALLDTGWHVHFPEWHREMAQFTDRVLAVADKRGVTPAVRAGMIVGSQFVGREATLGRFLRRVDAPIWLRRSVAKLVVSEHTTERIGLDAQMRVIARRLGTEVELQHWLLVHWFHPGSPVWASAERQGILTGPLPRTITGEHLIARGFEPGPIFGTVLAQAEIAQDRQGWNTEAEAVAWLDSTWTLKEKA